VVVSELVGEDVQQLVRARLGFGPAHFDLAKRPLDANAERPQVVDELGVLRRLGDRYALYGEQVEDVAVLALHVGRPPVPEVVVPRADGHDARSAPAGAVGRGVEHDRVEAHRDLVPAGQQRYEPPQLGNRDQVP
jgi:hypothetical protein